MDFHYLDSLKRVQWIRISYLSSSYTTCQQGWFISRQQLSIICKTDTRDFGNVLKRGSNLWQFLLKKDFTAETCCCYFLLAQHSEVPQNSTHLSMGFEIISCLEKNISEIISSETWIYSEVPQNSPRSSWTAAMGALNCLLCGGTNSQSKIIFDLGTGWESSKITT